MNRLSRILPSVILFLLAIAAIPANAQKPCWAGLPMLGGVSGMTGNPLQADVKITFSNEKNEAFSQLYGNRPYQVARDTQGRVRTDWISGKYKVQTGADAGREMEKHNITICDPAAGQIFLDTLDKTATIYKSPFLVAHSGSLPSGVAIPGFCSQQLGQLPNAAKGDAEDLGHRIIEGFDAIGVSRKPIAKTVANDPSTRQITSATEVWCSEELGAVVLRTMGTVEKGISQTISLANIQRSEPDPTLFQIPPDYRVVERITDPSPRQGAVASAGFGSSAPSQPEQSAPPAKP